jgi:type II secretory ATPase GspE/PulE/Tfp pilus assembly ATPase PilB-like protein
MDKGDESMEDVKQFVQLVLAQAHRDNATDLAIGAITDDTTPIKYKVEGQWYDMAPPPARLRQSIVTELGRLADLPEGPFPKHGTIKALTDEVSSKWEMTAPTAEGEWMLTPSAE